jgi:hypothetical protein
MDVLAGVMAEAIKAATAPLLARIAALEARPVIHGRDGRDGSPGPAGEKGATGDRGERGEPGKDAPPVDTDAIVKAVVKQIPTPVNGRDGKDADTAVLEVLKADVDGLRKAVSDLTMKAQTPQEPVADLVQKAIAAIPAPKDGRDGERGKDGTSVTVDDVAPLIQSEVAKAVSAIPAPKDGRDGADGVGVAGAVIGRDGDLILTLSDGTVKSLGLVVGRDGQRGEKGEPGTHGKDGLDGLGFEDLAVVLEDDERTFVITAIKGERVKEIGRFKVPVLIYRDVYKPGQKYEPGDVVTWGNQSFVCKEATTIKPGDGPAWRLMVRKGGDGKAGPPGPKGDRGERGEPGPLAKVY